MKRILINLTAVVLLPFLVAASCGTSKKTTPPILRHYDRTSGKYVDLNPFGEKN